MVMSEGGAKPLFGDRNMKIQDSSPLDCRNMKMKMPFCVGCGHYR
jgi:hypothetical protein